MNTHRLNDNENENKITSADNISTRITTKLAKIYPLHITDT